MFTSTIKYLGGLRSELQHVRSGQQIITDAPLDNQGKGEAFSPTDLLATSLGACMLTIMGIHADQNNLSIEGSTMNVLKNMESDPRRVGEIKIEILVRHKGLSDKDKSILERKALGCPVAKSLSADLKQSVVFSYQEV